jgi:hypothetical protein
VEDDDSRERGRDRERLREGWGGRGVLKTAANRWGPQVKKRNRKGKIVESKGDMRIGLLLGEK